MFTCMNYMYVAVFRPWLAFERLVTRPIYSGGELLVVRVNTSQLLFILSGDCNSLLLDIRLLPKRRVTRLSFTNCSKLIFLAVVGLGAPQNRRFINFSNEWMKHGWMLGYVCLVKRRCGSAAISPLIWMSFCCRLLKHYRRWCLGVSSAAWAPWVYSAQ